MSKDARPIWDLRANWKKVCGLKESACRWSGIYAASLGIRPGIYAGLQSRLECSRGSTGCGVAAAGAPPRCIYAQINPASMPGV
jgi:hypothetical protein